MWHMFGDRRPVCTVPVPIATATVHTGSPVGRDWQRGRLKCQLGHTRASAEPGSSGSRITYVPRLSQCAGGKPQLWITQAPLDNGGDFVGLGAGKSSVIMETIGRDCLLSLRGLSRGWP
jgi:hypothetical protein